MSIYSAEQQLGRRTPPVVLIHHAKNSIHQLMSSVPGIHSVLLASTDGFELCSVQKDDSIQGGKLAAVSSSILALVQAFLGEIHFTGCQSMTLEAENGKAIIAAVNAKNHPMLLVVITGKSVLLGHLLHSLKACTAELASHDQTYG
ncbi:MAG: roadblock/LC7 domain-containing protein [Pseudomonadota bacterium]|nr:roadblock/LC7 domain-containing protein [Pseudomonadota bacterium]